MRAPFWQLLQEGFVSPQVVKGVVWHYKGLNNFQWYGSRFAVKLQGRLLQIDLNMILVNMQVFLRYMIPSCFTVS